MNKVLVSHSMLKYGVTQEIRKIKGKNNAYSTCGETQMSVVKYRTVVLKIGHVNFVGQMWTIQQGCFALSRRINQYLSVAFREL